MDDSHYRQDSTTDVEDGVIDVVKDSDAEDDFNEKDDNGEVWTSSPTQEKLDSGRLDPRGFGADQWEIRSRLNQASVVDEPYRKVCAPSQRDVFKQVELGICRRLRERAREQDTDLHRGLRFKTMSVPRPCSRSELTNFRGHLASHGEAETRIVTIPQCLTRTHGSSAESSWTSTTRACAQPGKRKSTSSSFL